MKAFPFLIVKEEVETLIRMRDIEGDKTQLIITENKIG